MKVVVRNAVFNSDFEPVFLELCKEERELIASMRDDDDHFAMFPKAMPEEQRIKVFAEAERLVEA